METNTISAEDIELASVTERKKICEANFNSHCEKIKNEINGIAENWFQIAYYVYEMNHFKYYANHYDNIVDCCKAEFGFKKSTTYNFINIVKDSACSSYVRYQDFIRSVKGWSYSQLVSMLSLSDKEREKATPDMSAREIKRLKTNSKRLESSEPETVPAEIVIDEFASLAPAEVVEPEPAAPAAADVVSKSEYDNLVVLLDDYDNRIEKLYDDINEANGKYEAERDSNHRINIKLCDMTAERDKALQDIVSLKAEIKKLKADNRKLRFEIKLMKESSTS